MAINSSLLGLLLGVVATLFSAGTRGDEVLEVWQTQGPISVLSGQNFTLECQVNGTGPNGPVKWFMGNGTTRTLIYADTRLYPRVTRTKPNSRTDFNISICNSVPDDTGIYYCVKQRRVPGKEDVDFQRGLGTEVVVRVVQETESQSPEGSSGSDVAGGKDHTEGRRDGIIPVVAGTVCALFAVLFSVALYLYIKKKRGKKPCPSRPEDPLPENPRTPHQTPADKEIVYVDVKHSGGVQKPRPSKPEEHSTYATIR